MLTVKQIKAKVDLARNGIDQQTSNIISDNEAKILDYIRKDQLYEKGINGNNEVIGRYRQTYTSESVGGWGNNSKIIGKGLPKKMGSPYNFVWSGYTESKFGLKYSSYTLNIFNKGDSASTLTVRYGESIFLLTDENKNKLSSEIIRPNLIKYFKTIFN